MVLTVSADQSIVSLGFLIDYALEHSPRLEATRQHWIAAQEEASIVGSLPDPKVSTTYFAQEVETRVGPQQLKLGISQSFPLFGKLRYSAQAARFDAKAEEHRYRSAKSMLIYSIKRDYYEYYYIEQAIRITQENLQFLEYLQNVAASRYRVGTASHADLIRAQIEVERLRNELIDLKQQRIPIRAKIIAEAYLSADYNLVAPSMMSTERLDVEYEALLDKVFTSNPQILAQQSLASAAQSKVLLAKSQSYPDLMVGVDYVITGESWMSDVQDSGKDPIMVMAAVNIPVYKGKYNAMTRRAKSMKISADLLIQALKNDLEADLQRALKKYNDAQRKVVLYGNSLLPKARESLEVIQQGYAAGNIDYLSLIDAYKTLLRLSLTHQRALADQAIQAAYIKMLSSEDLHSFEQAQQGEHNE